MYQRVLALPPFGSYLSDNNFENLPAELFDQGLDSLKHMYDKKAFFGEILVVPGRQHRLDYTRSNGGWLNVLQHPLKLQLWH